eukprot:TRINITY_DN14230_c0_g1_i1.p2 TRINITY_DN14230_c0_g1~~TRINITY_DN14230_c0_g1_i1.p2  ORF type:complete len:320 (+),score=71.25 TRINITY_DN14230_c0_g1_i1:110-1069(+)
MEASCAVPVPCSWSPPARPLSVAGCADTLRGVLGQPCPNSPPLWNAHCPARPLAPCGECGSLGEDLDDTCAQCGLSSACSCCSSASPSDMSGAALYPECYAASQHSEGTPPAAADWGAACGAADSAAASLPPEECDGEPRCRAASPPPAPPPNCCPAPAAPQQQQHGGPAGAAGRPCPAAAEFGPGGHLDEDAAAPGCYFGRPPQPSLEERDSLIAIRILVSEARRQELRKHGECLSPRRAAEIDRKWRKIGSASVSAVRTGSCSAAEIRERLWALFIFLEGVSQEEFSLDVEEAQQRRLEFLEHLRSSGRLFAPAATA